MTNSRSVYPLLVLAGFAFCSCSKQAADPPNMAPHAQDKKLVRERNVVPPVIRQAGLSPAQKVSGQKPAQITRFNFKIDPDTPIKDLLPPAPTTKPIGGPVLDGDLAKVPEVEFQARSHDAKDWRPQQFAKIDYLNAKKTDGFMLALLANREDLAGMPFAMGDECRASEERHKWFFHAVSAVRSVQAMAPRDPPTTRSNELKFWARFRGVRFSTSNEQEIEYQTLAGIAATMQIMAPENPEMRLGLVQYLSIIPHAEATQALAKMAIFSPEHDIRDAAIQLLKKREGGDYSDILIKGLRYPWPAVAEHAAEAIARLGRSDLIPELKAVLASDDPRLPAMKSVEGQEVATVRELVKVNHLRNCLMCHAPADPQNQTRLILTAELPVNGQPLPEPSQDYYQQSSPLSSDLLVRADVTYLRQDFSTLLPVENAHPWPTMQRFDFFVRERKLTAEEAEEYKVKLDSQKAAVLSPYHKAAMAALWKLTRHEIMSIIAPW